MSYNTINSSQWGGALAFPVGTILYFTTEISPASLYGGTWEQIKDAFLLAAGDIYSLGDTGGEAEHSLTMAEGPAHTHTRGTMEIVGSVFPHWSDTSGSGIIIYPQDKSNSALYTSRNFENVATKTSWWSTSQQTNGTQESYHNTINFQASRTWTGETSSVGDSEAHNNMPPYRTVYIWEKVEE